MEYFAGLDVSMEETHLCVVDRDGKVILRPGRQPHPGQSPQLWRKGRLSSASYLKRDAWRRHFFTV
jgi:hypothetical protein